MEILLLVAVGGGFAWQYMNYKRLKSRIAYNAVRITAIEKHLGITPPAPEPDDD